MMTVERAEEIRASVWRNMQGSLEEFTAAERAEIVAFWNRADKPGTRSFYDAVAAMAKGEHLAAPTEGCLCGHFHRTHVNGRWCGSCACACFQSDGRGVHDASPRAVLGERSAVGAR